MVLNPIDLMFSHSKLYTYIILYFPNHELQRVPYVHYVPKATPSPFRFRSARLVLLGPEEDPPIAPSRCHHGGGGFVAGAVHEAHVAVLTRLQHLQQGMVASGGKMVGKMVGKMAWP